MSISTTFSRPARVSRMRSFGGPSVWLEFTPLARLNHAINLGQGSPAWAPPSFLTSALRAAAGDDAHAQYARSAGAPALVREIARVYTPRVVPRALRPGRVLHPEAEVLVTAGATQALYVACVALLDVGDEAVLIAPAFDIYAGAVALAGAHAVYVPLRGGGGGGGGGKDGGEAQGRSSRQLALDYDEFAACLSERTRVLILNSPHNPTGKVFSRDELQRVAEILEDRAPHCVVLSDEVYEHLVFDGKHVPFASVSEAAFERTLTAYSAGKTFSATGLKVGWIVGPANLIRDLQLAHQYIMYANNAHSQIAVAEALRIADEAYQDHENYYEWLRETYRKKRDYLVSAIRDAGMTPIVPQGAFFVCAEVAHSHHTRQPLGLPPQVQSLVTEGALDIDTRTANRVDYNICRNLILQNGVAAIPVSAFFAEQHIEKVPLAKDYIRFAFCQKDDELKKAREKLCSSPK